MTGDLAISAFGSFTLAVIFLLSGKAIALRSQTIRAYSIPEPVVGGLICVVLIALGWALLDMRPVFHLPARDILLLYFFAGIGLKSDIRTLASGGRMLVVLLALSVAFMVIQNGAGMGLAAAFGMDPKAGLMTGSISLTGGVGTTLAWKDIFVNELGVSNALELGVASNMVGLVAACVIGGPIARFLILRHALKTSNSPVLDVGLHHAAPDDGRLDYYSVLWAALFIHLAIILGWGVDVLAATAGLTIPALVGALGGGILLRSILPLLRGRVLGVERLWPGTRQALSLISDLSLGLFLVMALMGLKPWELAGDLAFLLVTLGVQIALATLWAVVIVFRAMGADYEAAVIAAAFGGISLGSTATAVANMTAVAQRYGAAHRAFVVVPLVCGFFIDIANALVVGALVAL